MVVNAARVLQIGDGAEKAGDLFGRQHCRQLVGGFPKRIAEVVEDDRVEHDAQRIRLAAHRRRRRREDALARGAAPELNDFDLLVADALPGNRGAATMRAALGAFFGVRNAR